MAYYSDDNESAKPKETAKKKVTRKANPEETLVRGPESPVESDEELAGKTTHGVSSGTEILAHGYDVLKIDDGLDMFDNERNYHRMCPQMGTVDDPTPNVRAYNQVRPTPGYGPKDKGLDQDSEDYDHDLNDKLDD